jgi:hypothetical protein
MPKALTITRDDYTAAELREAATHSNDADATRRMLALALVLEGYKGGEAPSNFFKERWAASYDPARKVTYVSWFLGTIAYFLDKVDFTTLVPHGEEEAWFADHFAETADLPTKFGSRPAIRCRGVPGATQPFASSS